MNHSENEKIEKAKVVLQKIAKGMDPLTGEALAEGSFLNDPRIIRCFYFVAEILDNVLQGRYGSQKSTSHTFVITPEDKSRVEFPSGNIGVNEFSKSINACIDLSKSKKLTGVELNRRLKKMGLLSEERTSDGKTRTTLSDVSTQYGFQTEHKEYNGVVYDKVVINDTGKKYLLDNLETIMADEE